MLLYSPWWKAAQSIVIKEKIQAEIISISRIIWPQTLPYKLFNNKLRCLVVNVSLLIVSSTYLTNTIQGFFCSSLFVKFSLKAHPPPLPLLFAEDDKKSCKRKLIGPFLHPSIAIHPLFLHFCLSGNVFPYSSQGWPLQLLVISSVSLAFLILEHLPLCAFQFLPPLGLLLFAF